MEEILIMEISPCTFPELSIRKILLPVKQKTLRIFSWKPGIAVIYRGLKDPERSGRKVR